MESQQGLNVTQLLSDVQQMVSSQLSSFKRQRNCKKIAAKLP